MSYPKQCRSVLLQLQSVPEHNSHTLLEICMEEGKPKGGVLCICKWKAINYLGGGLLCYVLYITQCILKRTILQSLLWAERVQNKLYYCVKRRALEKIDELLSSLPVSPIQHPYTAMFLNYYDISKGLAENVEKYESSRTVGTRTAPERISFSKTVELRRWWFRPARSYQGGFKIPSSEPTSTPSP